MTTADWSLKGMEPRRLAQALTFVDWSMFQYLSGQELLCGARKGAVVSPVTIKGHLTAQTNSIVNITQCWNNLSRWVPSMVLFAKAQPGKDMAKVRAKILRKFIEIALELKALDNWSSLFAIVIGLGSSALSCLKETWNLVPAKHVQHFRELEEACQPIANFRIYRTALEKKLEAKQFCIPYLAIVLKDFEAVQVGNPTKNARGWINFEKMQLLTVSMLHIQSLQDATCPVMKSVEKKHLLAVTNFGN
jgi:hypothetical protein